MEKYARHPRTFTIWIYSKSSFGIGASRNKLFFICQLFCVDKDYAKTIGINVNTLRNVLLVLLSLSVVTGIQATGAILTNALLIIPTAAARLVTNRLIPLMVTAVIMTIVCCIAGVY